MRHLKKGLKLKRTSSHRNALLRNLAISLLEHKKIVTTLAKAKALRPFVERIITSAKHAVIREKNGQLPEGQTIDVHTRRVVGKLIHNKGVLQELFDTIAPTVIDRPGGYTRIVKLGFRRGDAAELAAIELVDWGAPQDGAVSLKSKKKATGKKQSPKKVKKVKKSKEQESITPQPVEETPSEEVTKIEGKTPDVLETTQTNEAEISPAQESVSSDETLTEIKSNLLDEQGSEAKKE